MNRHNLGRAQCHILASAGSYALDGTISLSGNIAPDKVLFTTKGTKNTKKRVREYGSRFIVSAWGQAETIKGKLYFKLSLQKQPQKTFGLRQAERPNKSVSFTLPLQFAANNVKKNQTLKAKPSIHFQRSLNPTCEHAVINLLALS